VSSSPATVVIVGAGVTGLSTAYHLAKERAGRIIVVDKGPVGDGSSGRAAGIITGLLWTEAGVLVRQRCLQLFPELSRELKGYQFRQVGCLNLFAADAWRDREPLLSLYNRYGVKYEILKADEIARRWPLLRPAPDAVGLFDPFGGYSEPSEYLPALRAKVQDMGVEVRESEQVMGLRIEGNAVRGVETGRGPVPADAVVCTVYSWTRALLEPIGLALPFKCFVHQRYLLRPAEELPVFPAVNANPYGGYFRPALNGCFLAGIETAEREEYRVDSPAFHQSALRVAPDLKEKLRQSLTPLFSPMANGSFQDEKVGLLTFSMDGEPILGPVRDFPGLYLGLAFHSGGFAYNPGSGELLAQYVARGATRIDVSAWSPDRFDREEGGRYLAAEYRQRDVALRKH
jgi:glycine/D-amino acid oxidase-like deaminating enzyme